jgi:hexosaminidase
MELFPGKVIHIGGDEVGFNFWTDSPAIMAKMKEMGIKTPAELQTHFTNEISDYLKSKGRRMMGWNEILGHDVATSKLALNAIVHFWKGDVSLASQAAAKGYEMVNSYHVFTYLDYSYSSIPLSKAYGFDPIPEGLDPQYHGKVLGLGCQMWEEWTPTVADMERQVFPRLAAYAEVGWTLPARKDFKNFEARLTQHKKRWDLLGSDTTDRIGRLR